RARCARRRWLGPSGPCGAAAPLLAGHVRGAAGDGVLALASGRRLASQARGGRARGGAVALVVPSRPGPDARGRAPGPPGDPPARRPGLRARGVAVGDRGRFGGGGASRGRPTGGRMGRWPPAGAVGGGGGAGAAGCVMARRLAEAGADVLLREAGAELASRRAGLLDVGPESRVVAHHDAELGGVPLELTRGRTLGGSGAVNGGYCSPMTPAELAVWGPGWPRRYAVGLARAAERLRPRVP